MRISLVAMTRVLPQALPVAGWQTTQDEKAFTAEDADILAEFAGRLCYQSWDRPNPKTRSNDGYLAHIIESQHFSVLEHASFSFYVDGVSRTLLAELTRHRHLSFSVLSQRYVDESDAEVVVPPILRDGGVLRVGLQENLAQLAAEARSHYRTIYLALTSVGVPRKQAREAARSVLPNATETRFIVTGNVRAWREVIAKRNHPAADAEIRLLARDVLSILKLAAPNSFQDTEVNAT